MRPQRRGGEDRDGRWKLIERTCLYFGEEVKTGRGGNWICQTERSLRITNKFITWSTALFILLERQKKVAGFFLDLNWDLFRSPVHRILILIIRLSCICRSSGNAKLWKSDFRAKSTGHLWVKLMSVRILCNTFVIQLVNNLRIAMINRWPIVSICADCLTE